MILHNENIKNLLNDNSEELFIDENKKRTEAWLMSLGLQLPSDQSSLGSVGSVSYDGKSVNINGVKIPFAVCDVNRCDPFRGRKFPISDMFITITSMYGRTDQNLRYMLLGNKANNESGRQAQPPATILYLSEDKERAKGLLRSLGLQLPSEHTVLGSLGSISYNGNDVNAVMFSDKHSVALQLM